MSSVDIHALQIDSTERVDRLSWYVSDAHRHGVIRAVRSAEASDAVRGETGSSVAWKA